MYGVSIDWAGHLVEVISGQSLEVYFREKIFAPLGMKDSGFVVSDEQRTRQARVHARQADGALAPQPWEPAPLTNPEAKPERYVLLKNSAVSTAGDVEQFIEIGGKRYSHIVDPKTGVGITGMGTG